MLRILMVLLLLANPTLNKSVFADDYSSSGESVNSASSPEQIQEPQATQPGQLPSQEQNLIVTNLEISPYYPYAQFINYQYQGYNDLFTNDEIIMEYMPDENGLFQSVVFNGTTAVAYIYQIRADGLYQLAETVGYQDVSDLRYSDLAYSQGESLILPIDLEVGMTYSSGYDNENTRLVEQVLSVFTLNGNSYENVIKIKETSPKYTDKKFYNYYYAPIYGLIYVEEVNQDGSVNPVYELISAQGPLS